MSDVLFGQSYYLRFDPKLWAAMQPYPPLATLYAASYLRHRNYEVALFDAMLAGSEDEWARALDGTSPRVAVIYEDNFNFLSKMCLLRMREAAFSMIERASARGCTVIVAGSDATDRAELYLSHGAHFVLNGEGEVTLAELLDRLCDRNEVPLDSIRGMTYRDKSGDGIVVTPRRPDLTDLDVLPLPCGAPGRRPCGWARNPARRRSSTRWTRGPASIRPVRRLAACTRPGSRSASSCSSATREKRARTSRRPCSSSAIVDRTISAFPLPIPCRAPSSIRPSPRPPGRRRTGAALPASPRCIT